MKGWLIILITIFCVTVFSFSALANSFPERAITLVVPVAPGGGSDLTMRALARELETILGVPVVIVNRPGAGGSVGLSEVAKAKPDGYTLVMVTEYNYNLPMTQKVDFTVDSFDYIAAVNFDPAAIAVGKNSPWQTLDDLVKFAIENPGVVTMGNSGFGNIWHIAAVAFERTIGAKFVHVPFNGAAPTITAALGGHISAMVASPPEMAAQVQAGELRLLGIMSEKRSDLFPEVPTFREQGYDLVFGTWRGVALPAGADESVINILENAIKQAVESEGFREFMQKQGLGILYRSREELVKFIQEDQVRFRTLLSEMGLLID